MQDPVLVAQDLHKSYGQTMAVQGISLSVARGEIFGLLGPNGAGKTTTISMLAGLLQPSAGTIRVCGLDLRTRLWEVKRRVGLVPQELALYPTLSAYDNLLYFGRIYGLRGQQLRRRVGAVLDLVSLADRAREPIETFSGGMKRRVNIAAGLLHEPEMLFLDEPTVGVDPQSRNAIFEGIEALNRAGLTILYTTHYMEEAQRLCHRVAIVDHGKIIAQDTPLALIRSLGGGMLRVGLENGHAELVARELAQLDSISAVSSREGELSVETPRAQEALRAILGVTARLDANITSLSIMEPSLETVFLRLTGAQLRD